MFYNLMNKLFGYDYIQEYWNGRYCTHYGGVFRVRADCNRNVFYWKRGKPVYIHTRFDVHWLTCEPVKYLYTFDEMLRRILEGTDKHYNLRWSPIYSKDRVKEVRFSNVVDKKEYLLSIDTEDMYSEEGLKNIDDFIELINSDVCNNH